MLIKFLACTLLLAAGCYPAAASMDAMYLPDYEELYFKLLDAASGPEYDAEFSRLPQEVQQLYIAAVFDMEIQNGGICQYFANCGPESAVRIAATLRALGLEPMALLYESFLHGQQIDPADLSAFRCDTVEELIALYQKHPEAEVFDAEYMKLRQELNFEAAMLQYAEEHL